MNKINKLYFLGAGSTASFGLPTTYKQSNIIKELVFKDNKDDLFSNFVKHYFNENNVNINELYNIIDYLILENTSINVNNKIYSHQELINCKNIITYSILNEFNKTISNNSDANEKLKYFYKRLAKDALGKKVKEYNEDIAVKRDFIFTDYAIINLNWDLYSIMPMFLAHQELNNTNNYYLSANKVNAKLKIFNDLGNVINLRTLADSTTIVSARVPTELIKKIEVLAKKTNRNEMIQILLTYAVDNAVVEGEEK